MFGRKRFRWASIIILALILTVALAPVAAADPPPLSDPTPDDQQPADTGETPGPGGSSGNGQGPPPTDDNTPGPNDNSGNGGGKMMDDKMMDDKMMAPSWPPSNMIVTHAATQVQLAPVNGGLQTYFIAPGGVGHSGPWIDTFANLATKYPTGGAMTLYTGSNPGTGKPITIYYLAAEKKIRVSTYYPDTQYDVNKPYVFTVDSGHNVVHDQW